MHHELSKDWPKWSAVYDLWEKAEVPEVTEVPFQIGEHYPSLRWMSLSSGKQVDLGNNPTESTAYHLIEYLKGKPSELRAAYKLYAFCRSEDLSMFPTFVLAPAMEQHGDVLHGWWNANAKHVLPWIENDRSRLAFDMRGKDQKKRWQEIVQEAARVWSLIAKHWGVVRTPDLMDRNSQEYKTYQAYLHDAHEKRERMEYERLKEKYRQ